MGEIYETIDHRVLGALCLIDQPTTQAITRPLHLKAEGVQFIRNLSSMYVIKFAPGLSEHTRVFKRPPLEVLESIPIQVTVDDPRGDYLPHIFTIYLPRDPLPTHSSNSNSLFRPIEHVMFSAPSAPLRVNWSTIRVSLSYKAGEKRPAPGALLLLKSGPNDSEVLAKGISDERGEALVIVPGIPITTFSDGNNGSSSIPEDTSSEPVMSFEIPAQLEIIFDPTASWPVDPYELEENSADLLHMTEHISLKTGRMEKLTITIPNN